VCEKKKKKKKNNGGLDISPLDRCLCVYGYGCWEQKAKMSLSVWWVIILLGEAVDLNTVDCTINWKWC